jgi:hypothetical protein
VSGRLLLVAALSALAACGLTEDPRLPDAVGEPGEVLVVTDSVTWAGPVGDALRETLGRSVAPPLDVADFHLRRRALTEESYAALQRARNVVFAAALDEPSAVARFLEARLDPAGVQKVREGRGIFVAPRRDVWAAGQAVVFAAAGSDSLLAEAFSRHADTLRTLFTSQAEAGLRAEMFARGRQAALEDTLLSAHDFAVNVQHDYVVTQDTTARPAGLPGRFVRLRRVLSDTWRDLWVYYEDAPSAADTLYTERVTDALLEAFVRGDYDASFVRVDRARPVRSDSVALAGRPARRARGLWRMTEDYMGGPFVRYSFYEPGQRRRYVVFGMVYAPQHAFGEDKREFLRQLEVIAQTFRTAGDAPSP